MFNSVIKKSQLAFLLTSYLTVITFLLIFFCHDCKLRIWFLQSIKRVRSGRLKTKVKSTSIDYFVKSELLQVFNGFLVDLLTHS